MSQIERDAVASARVFLLALFVLGLVTLTSGLQAASQAPAKDVAGHRELHANRQ